MNKNMTSTIKRITVRGLLLVACIIAPALQLFTASPAVAATTLPVLWTAGGLSAGTDSAGQAARIATDASGNVAVVSGPSGGRNLAVTSYTATGVFRWRSTVSPSTGTFEGAWVVAAPNGDFLAVGYTVDSHGYPRGSTLVRYASDGTLRWRVDLVALVSRLVVDTGGNAYLAISSQDVQLLKYNPSGVLLWATGNPMGDPYSGIAFIAQSLALSPDQADVVLTGDRAGGATWITAAFNAATGARKWLVMADEGIFTSDVVVDASRVYVTGEGNVGINGFLTVVAYDRATGARLWRTDANPPTCCAYASRIALAPDGSLLVAGQTSSGGYFDWWIVAMDADGAVRWQARRDRAISGDEIPAAIFVLADGTAVVSGTGGPVTRDILGNSYMQGVTAGYSSNGTLLWEAFSKLPTVWAMALPNGDVCATGGYDALITCWRVSGVAGNQPPTAVMTATPSTGAVPLTVTFDGSGSTDPDGTIASYSWNFGDGTTSSQANPPPHTYTVPGPYVASLTVTDNGGAATTQTILVKAVAPNQLPVAVASAAPMNGPAPLNVIFYADGSYDPDGFLGNIQWTFSDGGSYLGSPAYHTFSSAGTYTATLTVTDNAGSTASASVTITVTASTAKTLRSTAINLSGTRIGSRVNVSGQVVVRNAANTAVSGVSVNVIWRKPDGTSVTQTATTGSSGTASFNTSGGRGTYKLTVTKISKTGYTFDAANSILTKSITK